MTRRVMFRLVLALRMLPNFAAYWWLLPRRMKHEREDWGRAVSLGPHAIRNYLRRIETPTERDFRIPFAVTFVGLPGNQR